MNREVFSCVKNWTQRYKILDNKEMMCLTGFRRDSSAISLYAIQLPFVSWTCVIGSVRMVYGFMLSTVSEPIMVVWSNPYMSNHHLSVLFFHFTTGIEMHTDLFFLQHHVQCMVVDGQKSLIFSISPHNISL